MTDLEARINFIDVLIKLGLAYEDMPLVFSWKMAAAALRAVNSFGTPDVLWVSPDTADGLKSLK